MESRSQKSPKNPRVTVQRWLIRAALLPIRAYQFFISPLLGPRCRFAPSCSHYACQALETHGILTGSFLALKRLSKCHPWHRGGYDPVPKAHKH